MSCGDKNATTQRSADLASVAITSPADKGKRKDQGANGEVLPFESAFFGLACGSDKNTRAASARNTLPINRPIQMASVLPNQAAAITNAVTWTNAVTNW